MIEAATIVALKKALEAEKVLRRAVQTLKKETETLPESVDDPKLFDKALSAVEQISSLALGELPQDDLPNVADDLPDQIGGVEDLADSAHPAELSDKVAEDTSMPLAELPEAPEDPMEAAPDGIETPDAEYTEPISEKDSAEKKEDVEEKKGGSYRDVRKTCDGETEEVHHIPADSVSPLERNDGPSIRMEKADHRQTASCGNSKEAQEYRQQQKELIDEGRFREAMQMDIDDIHDKFGDKYDDAIAEMLDYADKLEAEGIING